MMSTGCLPCVPISYSLVPPRNSRIGRRALTALSSAGVVLLYVDEAVMTSIWNQRLLRLHALRSGESNAIVK